MHPRLSMISRIFPWGSTLKPSPLAACPTPYSSVESTSHLPRPIPGSRPTQSIKCKAYFRIRFWEEADRFYSIRGQKMSFLHLLRCSTVQNPGWTPSAINGDGHALRRQNNSLNDASRYNYLQVVSNSGERIGEDFERHISGTSVSTLIRDQSSSGFRKVQEEVYATLDPAWTLDLDDTSALKDMQEAMTCMISQRTRRTCQCSTSRSTRIKICCRKATKILALRTTSQYMESYKRMSQLPMAQDQILKKTWLTLAISIILPGTLPSTRQTMTVPC